MSRLPVLHPASGEAAPARGGRARSRPPYSVLAPYYDEVYAVWRAFLGPARDEVLRAHGVRYGSALDLGCGSGWQSLELARRGVRVVAVEPVAAFLPPLRRAARAEGLPLEVRRGHALAIPAEDATADLVLATFDVYNHLADHAELAPALAEAARVLAPGGHLLFDVNTPGVLEGVAEHHRVSRLAGGGLSAETGLWDAGTRRATIVRDWFLPDPGSPAARRFRRFREEYVEIGWPASALRRALSRAGLRVRLFADAAGWLSFLPEGTRWIVLARKVPGRKRG